MSCHLIYFVLILSPVLSRQIPNFSDMDEDEQHLFRAAYDTPSYDHDQYEEDLTPGKLDLVKDGLWALKAKMKELKAFNKALAANVLSTKLKLKELLKNHLVTIKKHHHEKPSYSYQPHEKPYNYQAPSYQAPYSYGEQYAAAPAQYAPEPAYAAPQYQHDPYYGH